MIRHGDQGELGDSGPVSDPVQPVREVRDTVPEIADRTVLRALAKLPADRFSNAADFANALEAARGAGQHLHLSPWPRWKDAATLREVYDKADAETMLEVVLGRGEVRDVAP